MDKVLKLEKDDKKCIRLFMFLNVYIIFKYYGNLEEFKKFLFSFDDDEVGFKVMSIFNNIYKDIYLKDFFLFEVKMKKVCNNIKNYLKKIDKEKVIYLYIYERLLYFLFVVCDFYVIIEFMNGVELNEFGEIVEISEFYDIYKSISVYRNIRKYENEEYYKDRKDFKNEKNINILRNEMFLDVEKELFKKINEDIFYLEVFIGSGKSNVFINLSFKFFEDSFILKKIFYVYLFNILVE